MEIKSEERELRREIASFSAVQHVADVRECLDVIKDDLSQKEKEENLHLIAVSSILHKLIWKCVDIEQTEENAELLLAMSKKQKEEKQREMSFDGELKENKSIIRSLLDELLANIDCQGCDMSEISSEFEMENVILDEINSILMENGQKNENYSIFATNSGGNKSNVEANVENNEKIADLGLFEVFASDEPKRERETQVSNDTNDIWIENHSLDSDKILAVAEKKENFVENENSSYLDENFDDEKEEIKFQGIRDVTQDLSDNLLVVNNTKQEIFSRLDDIFDENMRKIEFDNSELFQQLTAYERETHDSASSNVILMENDNENENSQYFDSKFDEKMENIPTEEIEFHDLGKIVLNEIFASDERGKMPNYGENKQKLEKNSMTDTKFQEMEKNGFFERLDVTNNFFMENDNKKKKSSQLDTNLDEEFAAKDEIRFEKDLEMEIEDSKMFNDEDNEQNMSQIVPELEEIDIRDVKFDNRTEIRHCDNERQVPKLEDDDMVIDDEEFYHQDEMKKSTKTDEKTVDPGEENVNFQQEPKNTSQNSIKKLVKFTQKIIYAYNYAHFNGKLTYGYVPKMQM
uniref:Uncharacterized protein n=1 Tax=Strigamia maritima TaxID=126957 RepID=T1JF19_STRMM